MRFCGVCENKLYIKSSSEDHVPTNNTSIVMYCKNCLSEEAFDASSVEENCVHTTTYTSNQDLYYKFIVNPFTKFDRTLPTIDIACQNTGCSSHEQQEKKKVVYIKYDKKELKYLYLCCVCDTYWTFGVRRGGGGGGGGGEK